LSRRKHRCPKHSREKKEPRTDGRSSAQPGGFPIFLLATVALGGVMPFTAGGCHQRSRPALAGRPRRALLPATPWLAYLFAIIHSLRRSAGKTPSGV
jgi:hypothetical protein